MHPLPCLYHPPSCQVFCSDPRGAKILSLDMDSHLSFTRHILASTVGKIPPEIPGQRHSLSVILHLSLCYTGTPTTLLFTHTPTALLCRSEAQDTPGLRHPEGLALGPYLLSCMG